MTAVRQLDGLADLYVEVYAEPPYCGAPKYSRGRFLRRTRSQAATAGFTLVTARRDDDLIGFAFGFAMMPGNWWANASPPPDYLGRAAKFAVVELVVAAAHRGHGVGRALLEALLAGRSERYATLAAVIDAEAYAWYLRSGWVKVGEFRAEPPFSDALVLDRLR